MTDWRLVKAIGKRVGACLRNQRERGKVRSEKSAGRHLVWMVTQ